MEHAELFISTCQRSKLVSRLLRGFIIAEVRFRLSTTNLTTLYTPPLRKLVNEARQLAPARVGKRPAPDEQILALLKTAARAFLARVIGLAGICRPPFSFCVYTLCCVTDSLCLPRRTFELLLHWDFVFVFTWVSGYNFIGCSVILNIARRLRVKLSRPWLARVSRRCHCHECLQSCTVNFAESAQQQQRPWGHSVRRVSATGTMYTRLNWCFNRSCRTDATIYVFSQSATDGLPCLARKPFGENSVKSHWEGTATLGKEVNPGQCLLCEAWLCENTQLKLRPGTKNFSTATQWGKELGSWWIPFYSGDLTDSDTPDVR